MHAIASSRLVSAGQQKGSDASDGKEGKDVVEGRMIKLSDSTDGPSRVKTISRHASCYFSTESDR